MAAPVAAKAALAVSQSKLGRYVLLAVVAFLVVLVTIPIALMGLVSAAFAGEEAVDESSVGNFTIGSCAPKCPGANGPQTGMSVKAALSLALSEVGSSRPTGYNMPGECIVSVRRWLSAGGGNFAGGGVVSGYVSSPALLVTDGSLRPGDVIQYTNTGNPEMFAGGVHTYMVSNVHGDGTHDVVESNNPGGSGLVGYRQHAVAEPPPGWHARVWRFAATPDI